MADNIAPEELDALLGTSETVSEDELNGLLGSAKLVDKNTDEVIPAKLSGDDPNRPTNDPVVDLTDRFKLSLGNEQGRVEYLKTKYEDATVNEKGTLVVKKDGLWSNVDPTGFSQKDPWEVTKEVVADTLADFSGDVLIGATAAGGSVGAGFATAGAGAVSGGVAGAAAGEYMRSSLGRLVGTYNATPEQQVKDVAFESMMQLVGAKFIPGVKKPVASIAKSVGKLSEKAGTKLARFYGSMNVGQDAMNTLLKHGKKVSTRMADVARRAGPDDARFIDTVKQDSLQAVQKVGQSAQKVLSGTYNKMKANIAKEVPDEFVARPAALTVNAYEELLSNGMSKVTRAGKELTDPDDIARTLQVFKQNGRLPKGTKIALKSQAELRRQLSASGQFDNDILKVVNDNEAYKALQQTSNMLDSLVNTSSTKGRAGAANLMEAKKQINGILGDLSDQARDKNFKSLGNLVDTLKRSTDKSMVDTFDKVNLGAQYTKMQSTYGNLKEALNPLLAAEKRSKGASGVQAYETLVNQLSSQPGKNITKKGSLTAIADAAQELGDTEASKFLRGVQETLEINDAALAFNPYVNKRGSTIGAIAAYSAFSLNAPLAASVATGAALGSPRAAKNVVRSSQVLWKGLKTLKGMSGRQIDMMTKDPNIASAFINGMTDAKELGQQTEEMLKSQLPPIPMRGSQ